MSLPVIRVLVRVEVEDMDSPLVRSANVGVERVAESMGSAEDDADLTERLLDEATRQVMRSVREQP